MCECYYYKNCKAEYKAGIEALKLGIFVINDSLDISLCLGNKARVYSSERRRDSFAKLAHTRIPVRDSQMLRK